MPQHGVVALSNAKGIMAFNSSVEGHNTCVAHHLLSFVRLEGCPLLQVQLLWVVLKTQWG